MIRCRLDPIKVSNNFLAPKKMEQAVQDFLDAGAEDVRIDFGVATQTWQNKPDFKIQANKDFSRDISTDYLIFKFVSGGTRVRYATMSSDWVSKTQPNVLGSGAGRGRMMFVSRKHPRPGIKARNFPHLIVQKWNPLLPPLFIRIIKAALNR